jgi:nucleoside-diphosphate-sugar epimerase
MRVFVTGGTGHSGSYIIPELIAAGHEVTGLARSDTAAAALSAHGANVRRGDLQDLDGLKEAAADSDGVIHLAHRQDLLPSGGIDAVAAAELPAVLAFGEALAGTGKPLVAAGSIGSPGWDDLGRPATEEDPALPGGDEYKGTLRVRNVVETTVVGLAERGVRSSIVRVPPIAHSTTDSAGFLPLLIALAKERASSATPETARTCGTPCTSAMSPPCSAWRWRRVRLASIGTRLRTGASRSARSPRPLAVVWACPP